MSYDPYQFFAEAHPKLRPVETNTAGIFLAGACQAPRDIPETVAQASGAAAKVAGTVQQRRAHPGAPDRRGQPHAAAHLVQVRGLLPVPDRLRLPGHRAEEIKARDGSVIKTIAKVNPGLCQGCGTCVATCRTKAIDIQGFSNEQIFAEIMTL